VKLLFIDQNDGIKEIRVTKAKVWAGVILLGVLFVVIVRYAFVPFTNTMYSWKLNKITDTNNQLISLVHNMQDRVASTEKHLLELENKDEAVRTYAGMATINDDIRKLGVGGTRYDKTTELDYLLPDDEARVSDLLIEIDRLERMTNLEQSSYELLDSAYRYQMSKVASTPSIRPIDIGYFTDRFGWRTDPFTGERKFHYGLDISAPTGTKVYATADGVIKYAKRRGGYGLVVSVSHPYGYETVYAHLSKMLVEAGQEVSRGDVIAEVGNTGRSTASHLHYELRITGEAQDPINYFFSGYLQ